jgi:hypothetical protein
VLGEPADPPGMAAQIEDHFMTAEYDGRVIALAVLVAA